MMSTRIKRKDFANHFFIHVYYMSKCGFVGLLYFFWSLVVAAKLTDLAEKPDWGKLDCFQESINREEFITELKEVYCPRESWWSPWVKIEKK